YIIEIRIFSSYCSKSEKYFRVSSEIYNRSDFTCKYHRITAHTQKPAQFNYLRSALLILTALFIFSPLKAQEMIKGSAIITSRSGSAHAKNASGERVSTASHEILLPSGLTLSTTKDAYIFLTFSNGVALAMNEESVVQCTNYTQRSFDKEDQARGLEPSVSNLKLRMRKGQIAIASNQLSPLSELRIQLPKGELRLHKGCCLIRLNKTGLHITAFEGNLIYYYPNSQSREFASTSKGSLTYYYPNNQSREFVSAPKGIRISEQSMERLQVAENTSLETLEAEQVHFCQAAQHASKRVTFRANESSKLPPEPVLIARPEYFQQPEFRPYLFKK
ncbi:MAG: hypothetical protein VXV91_04995, partial [Verrucomicrobiota bacterium]|nr:hypothetical protein [Verrucomicrobiota bacterium]